MAEAQNLAQKLLAGHLSAGEIVPGEEMDLAVDQVLIEDATGSMTALQFEELEVGLALDGFTDARRILEGDQGMAAGMSSDADPAKLTEGLGERWVVLETSFKYHAACRHTHPAADALLEGIKEHGLGVDDIARVCARVQAPAIDVLGPVTDPRTVHQFKFSMGFVLAQVALKGSARIDDFTEEALEDPGRREFSERVEMVQDSEVDAAYPERWIGLIEIETTGSETITSRVEVLKEDPGNTLSREEIEEKARKLAEYRGGASEEKMAQIIDRAWNLDHEPDVRNLLPGSVERDTQPARGAVRRNES